MKKTIIIACTLALCATATIAQEIELYSSDGSLTLRGQLIEFVDQQYTIETSIGKMTVESNNMLCRGDACPVIDSPTSEFSIVGVGMQMSKIMPGFLPAFAQSLGAQVNKAADGSYALTSAEDEQIATVSMYSTSSSDSLPGLVRGQSAIALTSKPLLPEETSELNLGEQTDQASNAEHVIGLHAISIITAKDNPINAISTDDVARVFSGEYNNWSELGGPDAPIQLYGPQKDSELARLLQTHVFGAQDNEKSPLSQDIVIAEDIAEQVSSNANAIGYTYYSNSQVAKTLDIQGVCGMATPANSFTIKAEEYPLTQRLYAYRLAQTNVEHIDTLLNFMQSDAGQEIVSSSGLVDQRDTNNPIKNQGIRFVNAIAASEATAESELLREMVTQIIGGSRLSTTFRFETGSNQMDNRALVDIGRLAKKLQSPEYSDKIVHLLGFTDSVGDFDLNEEVSLRRAIQVRDALIDIDTALAERVSILARGFGEIAPIACNETAQGRSINRRVEVWLGKSETSPTQ